MSLAPRLKKKIILIICGTHPKDWTNEFTQKINKLGEIMTPLVPEKIEEDKAIFSMISNWRKLVVEFTIRRGKIELIFERYKLRKAE